MVEKDEMKILKIIYLTILFYNGLDISSLTNHYQDHEDKWFIENGLLINSANVSIQIYCGDQLY